MRKYLIEWYLNGNGGNSKDHDDLQQQSIENATQQKRTDISGANSSLSLPDIN